MKFVVIITVILLNFEVFGQKTIELYEGLPPFSKSTSLKDSIVQFGEMVWMPRIITPKITIYLPNKNSNTHRAVLICPGGGYTGLAVKHEGHDIAKKLQSKGIAGIVLEYRIPFTEFIDQKNKEIVPLMDAQRAIQLIRENANKWAINPNKVGVMGSSAGGHLASTLGTKFSKTLIPNPKNTKIRPDFLVLLYPVISFADSITHHGSRFNLIGELPLKEFQDLSKDWRTADDLLRPLPLKSEKVLEFSSERNVSSTTPPSFVIHAVDDDVVPIHNALLFVSALHQNKVNVETFFYAKGGHGFGLDNPTAEKDWIEKCIPWILKI
jgi:acetyl esterase/lipase